MIDVIESTAAGLDLLTELMSTLKVDDATVRTQIVEDISTVYAQLNQCKAKAKIKQKNLGSTEAIAQFGAQFKLFSQSITNAISLANTPEKCDEQLSRLLVQLEELESEFGSFDEFLIDIVEKREEVYDSFEGHKQQLLDARQKKAQSIADAAERVLASIEKRSLTFTDPDVLNTYFASDALVVKSREMVGQLIELDSAVMAGDVSSRLKAIKEQAIRSLRDKVDIYEDGGQTIKLGPRHRFSVNTQPLDLTIIPRKGELQFHLTGTSYFEPIHDERLLSLNDYWGMSLTSESAEVYRGEFLASSIISAAIEQRETLSWDSLKASIREGSLDKLVREFATPRYKEGYEKGVHDTDAALILEKLVPALEQADFLKYDPQSRALAQLFWSAHDTGKNTVSRGANDRTDSILLS